MSRLHKILLGVFCGGVLLCGIGTGVMLIEFSAFTYGGERTVGKVDLQTMDIDVPFEVSGYRQTPIWNCYDLVDEIQTDRNVPEDTVRFSVTYNAARVKPEADWNETDRAVFFHRIWLGGDDVAAAMEVKDIFLEGMRERKIYSFDTVAFQEVEVKVNPVNIDDVRLGM